VNKVYVVGVGMTPFRKPGREESTTARGDRAAIPAGRAQNNGYPQMVREAGQAALRDAGIGYDRIGSTIDSGATTYGGSWVVNPSGGLISNGHPLGAGLAQCSELTWQLRGTAGPRQVDGARIALQHNIGLGGAAVVTMYTKP
jgi:acetyl-CoA acetyltransferase